MAQNSESKMLPCSNCGEDLYYRDCEETTKLVERGDGFEFQGKAGKFECPALKCPECGEVTAL